MRYILGIMNKKLLATLFFIAITTVTLSQQKRKILIGKITDSLGSVKNINVINLNTNQGTFTNDDGLYRIFVSEKDSIRVSSVQHIPKKISITKRIFDDGVLDINIKLAVTELDEFELRRTKLIGRLGIDIKDVPNDKRDSLLRVAMDFSNIDFKEKDNTIDVIEKNKPPIVNTMDGAMPMIGGATIVMPFKYSERLWALRKELAQKRAFPYKIMSELGEKFFFDELKIPIEKYFHFLEYCNPLGIEDLYKNGRTLEVIKILKEESESYLKIIKEQE